MPETRKELKEIFSKIYIEGMATHEAIFESLNKKQKYFYLMEMTRKFGENHPDGLSSTRILCNECREKWGAHLGVKCMGIPIPEQIRKAVTYFRNPDLDEMLEAAKIQNLIKAETRKYEEKIEELKREYENTARLPNVGIEHMKEGFSLLRIDDGESHRIRAGLIRKAQFTIKSYTLGILAHTIPEKLQVKIDGYLMGIFDGNGHLTYMNLLNSNFLPLVTPHTNGRSICLGDINGRVKDVLISNPESVKNFWKSVENTLETINPSSPLHSGFSTDNPLHATWEYVKKEYDKWIDENAECRLCGRRGDDCGCPRCESCGNATESLCEDGHCEDCCGCNNEENEEVE